MASLYVQVFNQQFYDDPRSVAANRLNFVATEFHNQPSQQYTFDYGTTNASATPYPIFATDDLAIAHFSADASTALLSDTNGEFGYSYYSITDIEKIDAPVGAIVASLTFDTIADGATNKSYTATEKNKLATLAAVAVSGAYSDLSGAPSIPSAQVNSDWGASSGITQVLNKPSLFSGVYTDLTGKPTLATVAGTGAYSDLTGKPSIPTVQVYDGTTQRAGAFCAIKSATVSSGVVVFNITSDGTSGGTALFPNGPIMDSIQLSVNDATAAYQMSWAWSNSNKTLTVTANKLTTANILTGILGQTNANSSVVKLSVYGY